MSAPAPVAEPSEFELADVGQAQGIGSAAGAYWARVRGGDLGALPAILGAVVLVIVFGVTLNQVAKKRY